MQPIPDVMQAARDGLAKLHGEPKQAVLTEEEAKMAQPQAEADAEAQELHSHDQITVLDSLVRCADLSDMRPTVLNVFHLAYAGDCPKPASLLHLTCRCGPSCHRTRPMSIPAAALQPSRRPFLPGQRSSKREMVSCHLATLPDWGQGTSSPVLLP